MKAIKHIVWMVALAMTAVTFGACSNEDDNVEQKNKDIVITATLPAMSGTSTRGLSTTDPGDGTLNAEWEVNDEIMVEYQTGDSPYTTANAKATVTSVDPTTKAATITFTAAGAMDGGDFSFGYPYNYYDPSGKGEDMSAQLGTLADIRANYDIFYGDGTISNGGTTFTLSALGMYRETNIFKITVSDGTHDLTSDVTSFDFNSVCTVTPTSQNPIYVAASQAWTGSGQDLTFTATVTGTYAGIYSCTKTIKDYGSSGFPVGQLFTINLVMAKSLNLTSPAVGQVIGSDGKNYAANSVPGGVDKVAVIAYVNGSHGLALALHDAAAGQMTWANANTAATNATPKFSNATWRVPTNDDWWRIFGQTGDVDTDAYADSSVLPGYILGAGGSNFQNNKYYWSGLEYDENYAWSLRFWTATSSRAYASFGAMSKTKADVYVRLCLAF